MHNLDFKSSNTLRMYSRERALSPEPAGYRIAYSAGRYFRVDWFHLLVVSWSASRAKEKDNHEIARTRNEHTKVQRGLTSCRRSMLPSAPSEPAAKLATARPSH